MRGFNINLNDGVNLWAFTNVGYYFGAGLLDLPRRQRLAYLPRLYHRYRKCGVSRVITLQICWNHLIAVIDKTKWPYVDFYSEP